MHSRNRTGRFLALSTIVLFVCGAIGCGDKHPNEKQVFKIKGTVTVDGKPQTDIQIALHDKAGPDNKQPTYPQGFTDAEGNIRIQLTKKVTELQLAITALRLPGRSLT